MGFLALFALWILVSAAFTPLIGYFLSESQDEPHGQGTEPRLEPSARTLSSRPRMEMWPDHTKLTEISSVMAHAPTPLPDRSSRLTSRIEPSTSEFPPKSR